MSNLMYKTRQTFPCFYNPHQADFVTVRLVLNNKDKLFVKQSQIGNI